MRLHSVRTNVAVALAAGLLAACSGDGERPSAPLPASAEPAPLPPTPAANAPSEGPRGTPEADTNDAAGGAAVRTFPAPRRGPHVVVPASPSLGCHLRTNVREYDFPEGAADPSVSVTGKTMCYVARGIKAASAVVHCHVSGTETGFCYDTLDNLANVLQRPATPDGDFLAAYLSEHADRAHTTVSGHSQGAHDASRIAGLLGPGDQLFLLQPASSALVPNRALLDAAGRGARVVVAWSTNDEASLGIRATAGDVPLISFPVQEGIRVHNAPNARDLLLRHFGVPEGQTVNPALDASILSNPGSPRGPWRFPVWQPL